MTDLISHIKQLNVNNQIWVDEDPDNRWAPMLSEDPEHWAWFGIYTVDQFNRYMAITEYSDVYKEIHGVRPRHINFHSLTLDEIKDLCDQLYSFGNMVQEANEHFDRLVEEDARLALMEDDPDPLPYEEYDQ